MWNPIGIVSVNATTEQVSFGPVVPDPAADRIWVRITTVDAGAIRPLAFGLVSFLGADGTRILGTSKYYPDENPTVVELGPGPTNGLAGTLDFRPRSYNLRWLAVGTPAKVWTLRAEIFGASITTDPAFSPPGIVRFFNKLVPYRGPVGTSDAWALRDAKRF